MRHKHNTRMADVEAMVYLLYDVWFFVKLRYHGVSFCAAISFRDFRPDPPCCLSQLSMLGEKHPHLFTLEEAVKLCEKIRIHVDESVKRSSF